MSPILIEMKKCARDEETVTTKDMLMLEAKEVRVSNFGDSHREIGIRFLDEKLHASSPDPYLPFVASYYSLPGNPFGSSVFKTFQ